MTRPDDQQPDDRDRRLADLLSDAVSDVEPANRLDDIRNRTKVNSMSSRRPWLYAVGGAVIATAAVITAIAVAGGGLPGADDDPDAAAQTTEAAEDTPSSEPSSEPPASDAPTEGGEVVGVYFAGDTPAGPRLYREFLRNSDETDPIAFAVDTSLAGEADDPDYRTLWPSGVSATEVGYSANSITLRLSGAPADRPSGMSADEAKLALQQVVYSAQAALGQGRVPVAVENLDGGDRVLGESVAKPLNAASALATLSHVSLSSPSEGQKVSGDSLEVEGVANSFEANVVVEIESTGSSGAGAGQPFTAEGWMGDKLFPFAGSVDISGLAPGEYVLTASTDDPSGGEEGFGPFSDTRTITIE